MTLYLFLFLWEGGCATLMGFFYYYFKIYKPKCINKQFNGKGELYKCGMDSVW